MSERKWHVEHADGHRWTRAELTALVRRGMGGRDRPGDCEWWDTYIDQKGNVVLVDTWGGWHGVTDDVDMEVVWDA